MSKTATEVDVDSMSIKAMKALIESVGMPHADCVEKSDLRARCREALARRGEAERGPSPAERAPSPTAGTEAPGEKLMDWQVKQREYEVKKARAKALKLRLTCTICGEKAKLNCPCGTTQCDPGARTGRGRRARAARRVPGRRHARPDRYCTTECQRIDWRDRGHRKACKKIRDERAAEATRAEAPPSGPPPTPEVVYGPAPRSHADEVRARIAAEHEAARLRREANPEPEPVNARYGSRCPICLEKWDVNEPNVLRVCCCRTVCRWCDKKIKMEEPCPLCRAPAAKSIAERLARLRRHVDNEQPEAITTLGDAYLHGNYDFVKSAKKAAKLYKRAVELGNVDAMIHLGLMYSDGRGGVRMDKKKTVQLYRMAANRGLAIGQQNLATELRELGCEEEAFRFYKLAVEQGLITAMTDLGCCYEFGVGVAQDLDEALRLHTRAAATSKQTARRRFEQYYTRDDYVAEQESVARTAQFGLDRITQTLAARRRRY